MLSLIERFLQHNRRWLFGVLLVVIVVPFVFTIGNMPGFFWKKKLSFERLKKRSGKQQMRISLIVILSRAATKNPPD